MDGGPGWAAVHGVAKSRTHPSDFTFTFHFNALEKEMATHSSVLAWRIPGTGEPGGLPSMGSQRVGHDWSDLAAAAGPFNPRFLSSSFVILSFTLYISIILQSIFSIPIYTSVFLITFTIQLLEFSPLKFLSPKLALHIFYFFPFPVWAFFFFLISFSSLWSHFSIVTILLFIHLLCSLV